MSTTGVVGMGFYVLRDNLEKNMDDLLIISIGMYVIFGIFTLILRQKTVYNYCINEVQGECESYLYFPSFAGALFNGIAILSFVAVFAAAVMMQSLIPLLGAGAVGLGYTGQLLGWKPAINNDESLPWKEYSFITLDYKRKMIVAHKTNIDIGFEFRFPDEKLFAEFLAFLNPAYDLMLNFSSGTGMRRISDVIGPKPTKSKASLTWSRPPTQTAATLDQQNQLDGMG